MRKAVLGLLVVGLTLLAFIGSAFVGDAKAQSCAAAPSGLVSWWPGDFDAGDIQGGNDGVLTNGASAAVPGKVAGAFTLDGLDDYISAGNDLSVRPQFPFSVDAWIKLDVLPSRGAPIITSSDPGGNGVYSGFTVFILSDGAIHAIIGDNTQCCNPIPRKSFITAPGVISAGSFFHVTVVLRDISSVEIYVDGISKPTGQSGLASGIGYAANNELRIGTALDPNPPATTLLFDGLIDEVELYSRALSAVEVQAIFNAGTAGKCGKLPCGRFITKFGRRGTGPGQFSAMRGIGLDGAGNVFVVDYTAGSAATRTSTANRVHKFDSNGTFLATWGSFCSLSDGEGCVDPDGPEGALELGDGQFKTPSDVAGDAAGNIYVADSGNRRIQKFDSNLNFLTKWRVKPFGDRFSGPEGIAIGSAGNVYAADFPDSFVLKYDSNGNFIRQWPSAFPFNIAVDSGGNVYVTNTERAGAENSGVQKYDANGTFLTNWGISRPRGIAVGSARNVFVTAGSSSLLVFDSNGTFLTRWGSFCSLRGGPGVPAGTGCVDPDGPEGPLELGDGQWVNPTGVAVDGAGNVYVVDQGNFRVQKFSCVATPEEQIDVVIDELLAILLDTPDANLAGRVEKMIVRLEVIAGALAETPPENKKALARIRSVVKTLKKAIRKGLDSSLATELMDQLAETSRQIAVDAIDQAIAGGGDPDKIVRAEQELGVGDALTAAGDFAGAVKKYRRALKQAERALP